MRKILYLMHVDWKWIKQRPHFIAEKLALNNKLIVYYPFSFDRKALCKNHTSSVKPFVLFRLPYQSKSRFIRKINLLIWRIQLHGTMLFTQPDCIYVPHPVFMDAIRGLKCRTMIYDCMDDYLELDSGNCTLIQKERELVHKAQRILVSSLSLKQKIMERYGVDEQKIELVRNGFSGSIIKSDSHSKKNDNIFHLCYIGTVSHWFDFELVQKIVSEFPNVVVDIIGPVGADVIVPDTLKSNQRIIFHGCIEHEKLFDEIKHFDCLIMPFLLNEIILSVDPVKLYEYINFNKNIISVKYDEILRFDEFVNFYSNHDEALSVVEKLLIDNSCKYSQRARNEFLQRNTWDERVRQIEELL